MRRYIRKYDLADHDRTKLDFVVSAYGPGMKDVSLAANAFVARYNKSHDHPLRGGHGMLSRCDPNYHDISLVRDALKLPDVIGGMGFGEFLGSSFRRRFVDAGAFDSVPFPSPPCPLFEGVDLVDASASYHLYGGSAFTFLVDTRKLEGKPIPLTWESILDPTYRDMVVCGFNIDDINEIILLYLYREFGKDGLRAFAGNLAGPVDTLDMMRVSLRQHNRHAIFLLPYFFGAAAPQESYLMHIWPRDGALLAPYYFLARNTGQESVCAILDFLLGESMVKALAGKEMFHVYAAGDHDGRDGRRLKWLGWDWLLERDIIATMRAIDDIVVPCVLEKHPELAGDRGHALWNG